MPVHSDSPDSSANSGPPGSTTHEKALTWRNKARSNLISLGISKGVSAVVSLLLAAYLTRALGPGNYGILGFGTALLSYFILFGRLGIPTLATREIAREPDLASKLTGQFLGMQLTLCLIGIAMYVPLVLALPKPGTFKIVLLIQGIGLLAHAGSLEWLFLGLERTKQLAITYVFVSLLHLASVLLLVRAPDDVAWAALASVASLMIGNGWLVVLAYRKFGSIKLSIDIEAWKAHLRPALPIAASTFLIAVYYNLDQVMLGLMKTDVEVGWYAAAYKGVTAALMPAMVIAQSFYPSLSVAKVDLDMIRDRMGGFVRTMLLVGAPIAICGSILGHDILVLFAGKEFEPATFAFVLLMANVGVVYASMIFGHPLLAWDRQLSYMYVVGGGAILNVLLNFILIPPYGINGAAWATASSEGIVLVGVAFHHFRITRHLYSSLFARSTFSVLVGIAAPLMLYRADLLPLWGVLLILPASYGVAAIATGLLPRASITAFLSRNPGH